MILEDWMKQLMDRQPGPAKLSEDNDSARLLRFVLNTEIHPLETEVICRYYGIGRKQQSIRAIMQEMAISSNTFYRLYDSAMNRLRDNERLEGLTHD